VARRQIAVIGLGRFGSAIATTLAELGQDVIGVDGDAERVRQLADTVTQAVELDATDERALRSVGIQDVDVAVVSIGENIESSLLVVMQLRELGSRASLRKR
jgi:trk system potassium uptake protein TrkA